MKEFPKGYYTSHISELVKAFAEDVEQWRNLLANWYGEKDAEAILDLSCEQFMSFIPQIPYIGGAQSYTDSLFHAVRCLALYKSMKQHGKTVEETGKLLYEAALAHTGHPQQVIPPSQRMTLEKLMERREQRAIWSQDHRFQEGYVYEFVRGDGITFDYGYDFLDCASQKFYHAHDADEFMPFYCYLDFTYSALYGPELIRTMTIAEGFPKCNHRFRIGKKGQVSWPPAFCKDHR